MNNELMLPDAALGPIQSHVKRFGEADAESGGFLLGGSANPRITHVAFADGRGVERARGGFRVSGPAMERLFAWAEEQSLRVWAQIHAHPTEAFLSLTDLRCGFSVEGFTSAVVPNFTDPPLSPGEWGWWRYQAKMWRVLGAPTVVASKVVTVSFDEAGVQ